MSFRQPDLTRKSPGHLKVSGGGPIIYRRLTPRSPLVTGVPGVLRSYPCTRLRTTPRLRVVTPTVGWAMVVSESMEGATGDGRSSTDSVDTRPGPFPSTPLCPGTGTTSRGPRVPKPTSTTRLPRVPDPVPVTVVSHNRLPKGTVTTLPKDKHYCVYYSRDTGWVSRSPPEEDKWRVESGEFWKVRERRLCTVYVRSTR